MLRKVAMTAEQLQKVEYWYMELYRLMWAMVWDVANTERFFLQPDDVFAELSEELVKVVQHYNKPDGEMKPLLIQSLRNRCTDLQVMEYHTHRNVIVDSLDEDMGSDGDDTALYNVVPGLSFEDSYFDVDELYKHLSDDGRLLVMEALDPSEHMIGQIDLAIMRKVTISEKGLWCIHPTKNMYRRALGWSVNRFEAAWDEVSEIVNSW